MERQTHSGTPRLWFAASYKCRFHLGFSIVTSWDAIQAEMAKPPQGQLAL